MHCLCLLAAHIVIALFCFFDSPWISHPFETITIPPFATSSIILQPDLLSRPVIDSIKHRLSLVALLITARQQQGTGISTDCLVSNSTSDCALSKLLYFQDKEVLITAHCRTLQAFVFTYAVR